MDINNIVYIIFSVVITSVTSAFVTMVKRITNAFKILQKSQQIMMKDRLVSAHDYFCQKGTIGKYSLETLEELYSEYCELGGNSFVKTMMNDIRELTVK